MSGWENKRWNMVSLGLFLNDYVSTDFVAKVRHGKKTRASEVPYSKQVRKSQTNMWRLCKLLIQSIYSQHLN